MNVVDFWKKFLLRCFIVSYALIIVSFFLWLGLRDFSFAYCHDMFGIDKIAYNKIVIDFFAAAKFMTFYVFLVPSLALYWLHKSHKDAWKKNIKLDD